MKSEDKIKRTKPKRQIHSKESKGQNANLTKKDKASIIHTGSFSSTWHFLKETAMKSVKAIRTKRSGAWKALLLAGAAIAVAIGITACGGGGSDSSNPPVVTPPTPATFTAAANYTCWNGTVYTATATSTVSQTAAQADADAAAKAKCPAQTVMCSSVEKMNAYGVCVAPPIAGAFTKDAANNTVPATAANFTWNDTAKVWMANIGVKITNPNHVTCQNVGDEITWIDGHKTPDGTDCWKKASADGTVKFAMSGIVVPSEPTRKLMFAYYTVNAPTTSLKYYQRFPVWQDNNTAAWIYSSASNGGNTQTFDYSYGTDKGFVVHDQYGCWELVWESTSKNFIAISATCKY